MGRLKAIEYIEKTRQEGFSEESIRKELERAGWPAGEISLAFVEAHMNDGASTPITPKEAFKAAQPMVPAKMVPQKQEQLPRESSIQTIRSFVEAHDAVEDISTGLRHTPVKEKLQADAPQEKPVIVNEDANLPEPYREPSSPARKIEVFYKKSTSPVHETPVPAPVFRAQPLSQENIFEEVADVQVPPVKVSKKKQPIPVPKPSSNMTLPIAAIVAVIGLVVSGYAAVRDFGRGSDDQLLASALHTTYQAGTFSYQIVFDINAAGKNVGMRPAALVVPSFASALLGVSTDLDRVHAETKGSIDYTQAADPKQTATTMLDIMSSVNKKVIVANRFIDGTQYVQVHHVSDDASTQAPLDVAATEGKWIALKDASFKSTYGAYLQALSKVDSDIATTQVALNDNQSGGLAGVVGALRDASSIKWEHMVFAEKLGTLDVKRLKGVVPKNTLQSIADSLGLPPPVGDADINVWISPHDTYIRKMSMHGTFSDGVSVFEVNADARLDNFGSQVAVEKPDNAYNFDELLADMLPIAQIRVRDQQRLADMHMLQEKLGQYFEKIRRYPDQLSALVPEFVAELPHDPKTQKAYTYKRGKTGYIISARLEDTGSPLLHQDAHPGDAVYDIGPATEQ